MNDVVSRIKVMGSGGRPAPAEGCGRYSAGVNGGEQNERLGGWQARRGGISRAVGSVAGAPGWVGGSVVGSRSGTGERGGGLLLVYFCLRFWLNQLNPVVRVNGASAAEVEIGRASCRERVS